MAVHPPMSYRKLKYSGTQRMHSKKRFLNSLKDFTPAGLGPNNKNTLKNSLNSCQIFRLLTNISNCAYTKQF
jgi:hypothetical protein